VFYGIFNNIRQIKSIFDADGLSNPDKIMAKALDRSLSLSHITFTEEEFTPFEQTTYHLLQQQFLDFHKKRKRDLHMELTKTLRALSIQTQFPCSVCPLERAVQLWTENENSLYWKVNEFLIQDNASSLQKVFSFLK
jgi:hypothetical protein